MIRSGRQWAFFLASSRDSLYLCCLVQKNETTKDAATPGAKRNYFAFWVTSAAKTHNSLLNQKLDAFEIPEKHCRHKWLENSNWLIEIY